MTGSFRKRSQTGILSRLTNFALALTIFSFAAVALIILKPHNSEDPFKREVDNIHHHLQSVCNSISNALRSPKDSNAVVSPYIDVSMLQAIISTYSSCQSAELFVCDVDNSVRLVAEVSAVRDSVGASSNESDLPPSPDRKLVAQLLSMPDSTQLPAMYSGNYSMYYHVFELPDGRPALLVATVEHDLVVADKPWLMHALFLLFLTTLLMVLLLVRQMKLRFRQPLEQLTTAMEKTGRGELVLVEEMPGEPELQGVATTFNSMSQAMYESQARLRKTAEKLTNSIDEMNRSRAFLSELIDWSPTCVITTTESGEVTLFSRKASEEFGIRSEEMTGKSIGPLFVQSVAPATIAKKMQNTRAAVEVTCRRKNGEQFPAHLLVTRIPGTDHSKSSWLYIVGDITESKSFQEMMVRLDRYYTRGEMAGDIAHEINNYLAILSGNLELVPLMVKKGQLDKLAQKTEVMRGTIDRIAMFCDGLMDHNGEGLNLSTVDLNQLILNLIAFIKPQNRFDGVTIDTRLSAELPLVELDLAQVQQVLVNLLNNAADAVNDNSGAKCIVISTFLNNDDHAGRAIVEVADSGNGVSRKHVEDIFEKRFTTKARGHGIGLITCKRIIDLHNGDLRYHFDEGAKFTFELPMRQLQKQGHTLAKSVDSDCESVAVTC